MSLAQCSKLIDDGNLCGETPLWDAREQKLYWTDSVGRKFFSYDWKTKHREIILQNFEVNGAALTESGDLVFINNSGVWFWYKRTFPRLLLNSAHGAKLQLNDCIADPKGRLLAGSCFYDPENSYELGKLFSIEQGMKVRILDEGFHLSNGLGFSTDNKILYFTDSVARTIYSYAYNPETGDVKDRKVFVKLDNSCGIPDGLTVDAEGFVWSAEWYGGCISRYDPDGKLERRIAVPAKQTSSLIFGGPDLQDIYITSAARSEPMPIMPPNYDAENGYFGGALFHMNIGIQGRQEYRTKLSI